MALILAMLFEILRRPTIGEVFTEMLLFLGPLWIAVVIGVLVGWVWKPKWAKLERKKLDCASPSSPSSPYSPTSLALRSLRLGMMPGFNSLKVQWPSCVSWVSDETTEQETFPKFRSSDCTSSQVERENLAVTSEDLEHLCQLVEVKDGGPSWLQMMDRSLPTMCYQAWRRDPENGPPQYRTRTVFENANPELVRDLFWDDDFRAKWDDMLVHSKILEECPTTGTMVVHWVRKFPFFCSDRDYTIGRRIWESGRSYYCVTKGVPCSAVPRLNKPRRVDLYYSSWCIRAVESRSGDGQLTACEVLLFHHEDMGIPWEIAKLGVRQGMWGTVKKIEPGLRAYQKAREAGLPLSRSAFLAHINTKINPDYLRSLEMGTTPPSDSSDAEVLDSSEEKPLGRNIPKYLVIGGAIVLACTLDRGLLTKAVIFGVARRFANIGRRL